MSDTAHKTVDDHHLAKPDSAHPGKVRPAALQRINWPTLGPLIALVIISIAFTFINSSFATWSNLRAILDQASIPLVLAMGATLVILMGSIDLSIQGVMAASGLTFVLLSANSVNGNEFGVGAIIAGLVVGVIFGAFSGIIHTKLRIPSFMATLGVWYIGLGVATVLFGDTVPELEDTGLLSWASATPLGIANGVLVAVVVVVITVLIMRFSSLGRNALAIGADENLARLNSIPVNRYKIYIFTFAGLLSGVAGILGTMRIGNGIVEVGSGQLFFTTAAVVVGGTLLSGGRGGPLRSVVGVFLLTVINNGLILSGASPVYQQLIAGIVIVTAVVLAGLRQRSRLRIIK
jgi:ribose transport system permease protein